MRKDAFCPELIEKIAEEYGTSKEITEYIVRSQFRYVVHVLEEGKGEAVRLHHFGIFRIKYDRKDNRATGKIEGVDKRAEEKCGNEH
jgi:nucleoid DNA-binding protein